LVFKILKCDIKPDLIAELDVLSPHHLICIAELSQAMYGGIVQSGFGGDFQIAQQSVHAIGRDDMELG
jgi:hypothetical protein